MRKCMVYSQYNCDDCGKCTRIELSLSEELTIYTDEPLEICKECTVKPTPTAIGTTLSVDCNFCDVPYILLDLLKQKKGKTYYKRRII